MKEGLPAGWMTATGKDLFTFVTSGSRGWAKYYSNNGQIFIRVGNFNRDSIDLDLTAIQYVQPPAGAEEIRTAIEAGDLLITITADVGMVGVAPTGLDAAFVNQHVAIARLKKGLDAKYLAWYLASNAHGQSQFQASNRGATKAGLGLDDIRNLTFELAPIPEQRRIVAKLESLLAKVGTSRQRLDRIPTILKRFRQSVLAAACEGKLTQNWRDEHSIPGNWPQQQLSTLGQVTGGLTKSAKREGMVRKAPYLRVANVYENRLSLDDIAVIGITEGELERTRLIEGDLLFVEGNGSLNQIGRVAMWDGTIEDCSHQNHLIKFRAGASVLPTYVLYQMMGPSCRTQLEEKATSSAGLHTLSISKISDVNLPIPTLSEQAEIVRRVTELFTFADQIEARYIKAKAQVDRLTQSILAKAFRGELVPQDPNDEPATALLERLKKTPSATPVAKRRGHPSKAKG